MRPGHQPHNKRDRVPCPKDADVSPTCRRIRWRAPAARPAWRQSPPRPRHHVRPGRVAARRRGQQRHVAVRSLRSTEELTQDEIAERLANPVRQVSEAQLRAQYGYVVADLRSMGLLALALFVLMILAALLL